MTDLKSELVAATLSTNELHWQLLRGLGVPFLTAANRRVRGQAAWGVAKAKAGEDGLFLIGEGVPHLLLPVIMDGELIDLVAFRSGNPNDWLLRTGLGWALGMDRGLEPYTWDDAPTLVETPLDWLRAECRGICVLDWSASELHSLKGIARLGCASDGLASTLRRHLIRDPNLPEIFTVPQGAGRMAA
jgi:hypothetical protein